MVRRSKDLVDWEFTGWAFDGIPDEAFDHVSGQNDEEPHNIWAPYIIKIGDTYRLYYSVSVFGSTGSYIGLATSTSLNGNWEQQGEVLSTIRNDTINAIDPSVVIDPTNGEYWMAYGSWFSGLYIVQLNPETGKPIQSGDRGKPIAKREGTAMEAPEIIYHEPSGMYYLFVSYGELFDVYNVRVGRSEYPDGPYLDYHGEDLAGKTDNLPLLTAPYQFSNHTGWQGVGHTGVFKNGEDYYMMHQGRPVLDPRLMVMHLRKLWWTSDGWPAASPQRFGAAEQQAITRDSISGRWEQITLESFEDAGERSQSVDIVLNDDGTTEGNGEWELQNNRLIINRVGEQFELRLSHGYDWENNKLSIIYTGLNNEGRSVWGKKTED